MEIETERMTSKGQVTIPVRIRKLLGLKPGDNVTFVQRDGQVYICAGTLEALDELQKLFAGVAAQLNVKNDEDAVALSKSIRSEMNRHKK
jgi:AbrB family looped-hinge helix DNA binding protein